LDFKESDWEKIIAEADADGDKSVSFDEFKSLISQCFLKNNNDDFQLS
jgi:Ca2+-binding EF-hand superfamily protein